MTDSKTAKHGSERAPTTVFVSYSREDRVRAMPIIQMIEEAGFSTWWDGLLAGGERFSHATEEALNGAKAVVVLWSKASVQSHWVHDEATRGRDRGALVPLSLDGSEPPLGFGQFQVINLANAKVRKDDSEVQRFLRAVAALHEKDIAFPTLKPVHASPFNRRTVLGGGAALVAASGGLFLWNAGIFEDGLLRNSLAVLPFDNLSGDPEQRYFSDGLASEIRTSLSRNALLEIVGQTSSNQFRDHDGDARSIAKELRVSFLLDGNVQKIGDRVKIAIELTDGQTGIKKWGEMFERRLTDIFAVQSEIANSIVGALSAAMDSTAVDAKEKQVGGTQSLAAFDAYLRGRDLFEAHVDESSERAALAKLEQAIAIDPGYAAARALRSRTLAVIANQYATADNRKQLYAKAVSEAQHAAKIAPTFAPAFAALGYALFYGRLDAKAARPPYERAFALAQSDVDVLSRYAVYCARTGRFADADAAINRAAALDPLNSSMFKSAGNIKYAARSYAAAIDYGRKALVLNPKRSTIHGDIGNALYMLGDLAKAEAEFGLETNTLLATPGNAMIARKKGNTAKAQKLFEDLVSEHGDNALYQQAQILAQWGDVETAFSALDKAYASADSGLVYLLNDPLLDPLRSDPRYKKLLMDLNFV